MRLLWINRGTSYRLLLLKEHPKFPIKLRIASSKWVTSKGHKGIPCWGFDLSELQSYKLFSPQFRSNQKLSPRFYGPFPVLKRIGNRAYGLPFGFSTTYQDSSSVHVSLVKTEKNLGSQVGSQFLVQRSNSFLEDVTWEFYYDFLRLSLGVKA